MIKVNGTDLETYGLIVRKVHNWWTFPGLKDAVINDWQDEDFREISSAFDHLKFGTTNITLDCYLIADNASQFKSRLDSIAGFLQSDDLLLMNYSDSSIAKLVRLDQKASFKVLPNLLQATTGMFKLVFEDCQPFNFQFPWTAESVETLEFTLNVDSPSYKIPKFFIRYGNVATKEVESVLNFAASNQLMTAGDHNIIMWGDIDSIVGINITDSGGFVSDEIDSWRYKTLRRNPSTTTILK